MKLLGSIVALCGYCFASWLLYSAGIPIWRVFVALSITMAVTAVRCFPQEEP